MTSTELPDGLAFVPVASVRPGPLQPRTNVLRDLVRQLADSMRSGRHEPLLEVEPVSMQPGHYQIVCGEQRRRAAKEAGIERVLVRVLHGLNYLSRLQKQYEENRLRADLTPADDAFLVFSMKTLKDIEVAERLLAESLVPFQPLSDKRVTERSELDEHRRTDAGLSQLSAKFVTEFVIDAADHRPTGTTKHCVTALRSLLRFLHLDGRAPNLVGVVPKVAGWHGAGLPQGLQPGEFERLNVDRRILLFFGTSGDIEYLYSLLDQLHLVREVIASRDLDRDEVTVTYYVFLLVPCADLVRPVGSSSRG